LFQPAAAQKLLIARLAGPLGRFDGVALILLGIALIVIAGFRYGRTARLNDLADYVARTMPQPAAAATRWC
jgi:hypothetical protein